MHVVASDDVRLEYRLVGEGERCFVFVHGWATSGAVYDDVLELLDTARTRCLVVDLRGSGASSRPATGYTLERYAEDVWAVIEHAGLERPVLVGHSMGGQIVQLMAAGRPDDVRGLFLLDPVPLAGLAMPDEVRELFRTSASDAGKYGTIFDMSTKLLEPEQRARLIELAVDVAEACIVESFDAWSAGACEEKTAAITAPTLVVATDDDFLPQALLRSAVVDRIARAQLRYLPGPGHYPQVERPGDTAAILEEFLAELG